MKFANSGVYACNTSRGGFASLPSKSMLPIFPSSSMTILCIIMHAFIISASVYSPPKTCWFTHNCKTGLKYLKCLLYSFSCRLLCFSKMFFLQTLWTWNCFYKCQSVWINTINNIISHSILMTINYIVHWRSMTIC